MSDASQQATTADATTMDAGLTPEEVRNNQVAAQQAAMAERDRLNLETYGLVGAVDGGGHVKAEQVGFVTGLVSLMKAFSVRQINVVMKP